MRCPVSFRILLPFDNGKWSRFGFNLLYTQSLIWCQILNPKLAKYLINPLSDICCKLKPVFSGLHKLLGLLDIKQEYYVWLHFVKIEKKKNIQISIWANMLNIYIDNSDIDIVGGQNEGRPKIFVKIFRIPCSKVKKSYMHFSYLRTKHCML